MIDLPDTQDNDSQDNTVIRFKPTIDQCETIWARLDPAGKLVYFNREKMLETKGSSDFQSAAIATLVEAVIEVLFPNNHSI